MAITRALGGGPIPWRDSGYDAYFRGLPAEVRDHVEDLYRYQGLFAAEQYLRDHYKKKVDPYGDPYKNKYYEVNKWATTATSSATLNINAVNYSSQATIQPEPHRTELQRMTEEVEKYCRIGRKKDF